MLCCVPAARTDVEVLAFLLCIREVLNGPCGKPMRVLDTLLELRCRLVVVVSHRHRVGVVAGEAILELGLERVGDVGAIDPYCAKQKARVKNATAGFSKGRTMVHPDQVCPEPVLTGKQPLCFFT